MVLSVPELVSAIHHYPIEIKVVHVHEILDTLAEHPPSLKADNTRL
jgi:hypothetical protein